MTEHDPIENRRILLVDDNRSIHADYAKILANKKAQDDLTDAARAIFGDDIDGQAPSSAPQRCFELTDAYQGQDAVDLAKQAVEEGNPFAVAFVDMRMPPGIDGVETLKQLWEADPRLQAVICTAYSDYTWAEMVSALDCQDRLVVLKKPFDSVEVLQLACTLTEKWQLSWQAQVKMEQLEQLVAQRTAELEDYVSRLQREIAQREEAENRLRHSALHDTLTDLPNRALLLERMERCFSRAHRNPEYRFAAMFIDLDGFKVINDSLGHRAGDRLLTEIAQRLQNCIRQIDTAARPGDETTARIGGDEFVILLDEIDDPDSLSVVGNRVLQTLRQPFTIDDHEVVVTGSIGIAMNDARYDRPEEMLRDADTALYRAKHMGKDCYTLFDGEMHENAKRRLKVEIELRKAPKLNQLQLVYQPIISLETGMIKSVEALLRWHHPDHGVIMPGEFIPVAEETGIIVELGEWVLTEACRQIAIWREHYPELTDLSVGVNISARQMRDKTLLERIDALMASGALDPSMLTLEITETTLMTDRELHSDILEEFKSRKLVLHMDDFGTGYSSLNYLHKLPIDAVKLDRAFVKTMAGNLDYAASVQAIITLAHNQGMVSIAEGVETADQMARLQALECDFAQGFLFGVPSEPRSIEKLLEAGGKINIEQALGVAETTPTA